MGLSIFRYDWIDGYHLLYFCSLALNSIAAQLLRLDTLALEALTRALYLFGKQVCLLRPSASILA
jgi:hypothetical protein